MERTDADDSRVVILYRGGRLPSWHALTPQQREAYEQVHVDRMLSEADQHGLSRLEGFKLITPQKAWERFWTIEFPSMTGARAWIDAETAPPYGRYGYYEYCLSMPWRVDYFSGWVTDPRPVSALSDTDPHRIPVLSADKESVVLLSFGRWRPESGELTPEERGDSERLARLDAVAHDYGLKRYEAFKLLGAQDDWQLVWILEFTDFDGAEAWIDAEVAPPHGHHSIRSFHFARRWAPDYFDTWPTSKPGLLGSD